MNPRLEASVPSANSLPDLPSWVQCRPPDSILVAASNQSPLPHQAPAQGPPSSRREQAHQCPNLASWA